MRICKFGWSHEDAIDAWKENPSRFTYQDVLQSVWDDYCNYVVWVIQAGYATPQYPRQQFRTSPEFVNWVHKWLES